MGPAHPAGRREVILGALRRQMLRFAYDEGDGAIVNLVFAEDLAGSPRARRRAAARQGDDRQALRLPHPGPRPRPRARPRVPGLVDQPEALPRLPRRASQRLAARGVAGRASRQGDTLGARAALPDDLVDALWLSGRPEDIREQIARYLQPGVTRIVLYVAPTPELIRDPYALPDVLHAIRPEPARV